MTVATKPTDAEIATAYTAAMSFADKIAGTHWEMRDAAHDGATNGIMWALANHDPDKGTFGPFAGRAVRRFVGRAVVKLSQKLSTRPRVVSLSLPDDAGEMELAGRDVDAGDIQLSERARELPKQLQDVVRLFYVDRFPMRDCALLLGCSADTVHERLKRAADLLAAGEPRPVRPAGTKRMTRG